MQPLVSVVVPASSHAANVRQVIKVVRWRICCQGVTAAVSTIERDAKILGSKTWHEHDASLQARIDVLQAHCDLLEAKLNVPPLQWLRYLARQVRAILKGGS